MASSGLQVTRGPADGFRSGFIELGTMSFRANDLIVTSQLDLTYAVQQIAVQRHLCQLMYSKFLGSDNKTMKTTLDSAQKLLGKLAHANLRKANELFGNLEKLLSFLPYTTTRATDGRVLYADNHHVRYALGLKKFLDEAYTDIKTLPEGTEGDLDDFHKITHLKATDIGDFNQNVHSYRQTMMIHEKATTTVTTTSTTKTTTTVAQPASGGKRKRREVSYNEKLRVSRRRRVRRQWDVGTFALATAATATSVYALSQSEANSANLERLDSAIANVDKRDDLLVKEIDLQGDHINKLQEDQKIMHKAVIEIAEAMSDEYESTSQQSISYLLETRQEDLQNYFDLIKDTISLAGQNKLNPYILTVPEAEAALIPIKLLAQKHGLELLYQHFAILFSAPLFLTSHKNVLQLSIMIPTKHERYELKLYLYLNAPLKYEGLSISLHDDEPRYLAINKINSISTTLLNQDLQKCKRSQQHYHCDELSNIFDRHLSGTCLSHIFNGQLSEVKKTCNYHIVKDETESIVRINDTLFQIVSPTNLNIDIECDDPALSGPHHLKPHEIVQINLPLQCKALTPNYLIFSSGTIKIPRPLHTLRPLVFNASGLLDLVDSCPIKQHLHNIIDSIKKAAPLDPINLHEFNESYNSLKSAFIRTMYHHRVELGLAGMFVIFIISVSIFFGCQAILKRYIKRKQKQGLNPNPPKPFRIFIPNKPQYSNRKRDETDYDQSLEPKQPLMRQKGPAPGVPPTAPKDQKAITYIDKYANW